MHAYVPSHEADFDHQSRRLICLRVGDAVNANQTMAVLVTVDGSSEKLRAIAPSKRDKAKVVGRVYEFRSAYHPKCR
jgi:hypothetical protein